MMTHRIRNLACAAFGFATIIGCSLNSNNVEANSTEIVGPSGGYKGLGRFTGISGTYGEDPVATDAAANSGGPERGGATNTVGVANGSGGLIHAATGGNTSNSTAIRDQASSGGASSGGASSGGASSGGASSGGASSGGASSGGASSGGASSGGAHPNVTAGGSVALGGAATASNIWPVRYDPQGTSSDPTGKHQPGASCITSACHGANQTTRAFAFGGTIYQSNGTSAAANVQIAIVSGSTVITTYSGTNGNFWAMAASTPSIDWSIAKVYLRNGRGELAKASAVTSAASCNSCHSATLRIVEP